MTNLNDSLEFTSLDTALAFAATLPPQTGVYIVAEGDVRQREGTVDTYAWRGISTLARPRMYGTERMRERVERNEREFFITPPDRYSVRWSWQA